MFWTYLGILHTQLLGGRGETLGKAVAPTNCCADSPATDKITKEEPNRKSVQILASDRDVLRAPDFTYLCKVYSVAAKFNENFKHDLDFFLDYQHIDGSLSCIPC